METDEITPLHFTVRNFIYILVKNINLVTHGWNFRAVSTDCNKLILLNVLSPIYTAENFWHGSDEKSARTQKIVLITHLHVLFSTVLNDVKLWFGTGKRLNISASVLDSCLVRMLLPL